MRAYPQRIVCLAAEVPEILERLGVFDRLVGVSAFTVTPEQARHLPRIGGFSTPHIQKVLDLNPDLVITISDIQAQAAHELIRHGIPVLALNPHRLEDVWQSIHMLGGILGVQTRAETLVARLQSELRQLAPGDAPAPRPKVYFEEWPDPMISGIGWVSDLIEQMGGDDVFHHLAAQPHAGQRIITPDAVIAAQPDLIVASWCGKPADLPAILKRPGWQTIPALQTGHVYEIESPDLLQVGPALLRGARQLRRLIRQVTLASRPGQSTAQFTSQSAPATTATGDETKP